MSSNTDILIIGGGLAGLCCALRPHQSGFSFQALPMQTPPVPDPTSRPAQIRPGLFVCGEYQNVASIQWAMVSGRQAAEAVIDWLPK